MQSTCPNCAAPSLERYCPRCGQDNALARLSARRILAEAFKNLVGWDSALGRTAKGLVLDPGGTAADYVAGRRRRYVNPARLCLLALAGWFLVTRIVGTDPMTASGIGFQITGDDVTDGAHLARRYREFLSRNLDVLLYLALPLYALALRLVFRGSKRNIAECLVLVLFVESLHYLLRLTLTPLESFSPTSTQLVRAALYLTWSVRACRTFFDVSWGGAIWRVALCKVLHILMTIALFALIALPWFLVFDG